MAVAAAITGAIALGTSIYQGVRARRAKKKAQKLADMAKAEGMPIELTKNQQLAEQVKNMGGMSSQEYQTALQNINRNQSAALSALRGRRSALAGVGKIVQGSDDAVADLDSHNAAVSRSNKIAGSHMEMQANAAKAAERSRQIMRDYTIPSQQATDESQALTGAAIQNLANGASAAAQIGFMNSANKADGNVPAENIPAAMNQIDVVRRYRIPKYRVNSGY